MTASATLPRPRLRGWLHATAAPVAAVGAVVLWRTAQTTGGRVTALIFGLALVGLYSASSLYHVPPWRPKIKTIMSRIDGAFIVLTIVGTFTPVAYHALDGAWRTASLAVAWTIAVGAIVVIASPVHIPRWLGGVLAMALGWLFIVPFTQIATVLPVQGSGLIVLGGLLYSVGALAYIAKWPNPFPRWFGFHEVFHLFVVAASALHWVAIYRYVLPG